MLFSETQRYMRVLRSDDTDPSAQQHCVNFPGGWNAIAVSFLMCVVYGSGRSCTLTSGDLWCRAEWKHLSAWLLQEVLSEVLDWEVQVFAFVCAVAQEQWLLKEAQKK